MSPNPIAPGRAQQVVWYLTGAGISGILRKPGTATIHVPGYVLHVEGQMPKHKARPGQRLAMLREEYPKAVPVLVRLFHDETGDALVTVTLETFTELIGGQR